MEDTLTGDPHSKFFHGKPLFSLIWTFSREYPRNYVNILGEGDCRNVSGCLRERRGSNHVDVLNICEHPYFTFEGLERINCSTIKKKIERNNSPQDI